MIIRTTADIFSGYTEEAFDGKNIQDILSLVKPWDYSRELQIEDVDLWETIQEFGSGGIYASLMPYAEFYLLKFGKDTVTFYGQGAQEELIKEAKRYNITISKNKTYVDPEDMWLYQ